VSAADETGGSDAAAVTERVKGIRCVLVIDQDLPRWLTVNTAAVLGVALGGHGIVPMGPSLLDNGGSEHPGIGALPLPVLAAPGPELPALRQISLKSGLFVIDFNSAARDSREYPEYEQKLASAEPSYLGIAIHGSAKLVTSITGNLRSLR
jgi:hypothetical protein